MARTIIPYRIKVDAKPAEGSIRSLINENKKLKDELENSADRGSKAFKRLEDQHRQNQKEITEFRRRIRGSKSLAENVADGMVSAFKRVGAVVAAAFSVDAIIGGFRSVIDVTANFEEALSKLSAITGATGEDLKFYEEQARDIGATTTLSASQAVEAFQLMGSAKPELLGVKEELAGVTREAVALAEAASLELPAATDILGTALNQFQAGAGEASSFVNILAESQKLGSALITDLGESLINVGPIAKTVGLSFAELNAALQGLAANGIKGARAGTGLKTVLARLAASDVKEINPTIVGLNTALENLEKRQLTVAEASEIFGVEMASAGLALINQREFINSLSEQLGRGGLTTAYEQAATNTDNFRGAQKELLSALESFQITLGQKVLPQLTEWARSLAEVVRELNVDALLKYLGVLLKFAGAYIGIRTAIVAFSIAQKAALAIQATYRSVVLATTAAYNIYFGSATRAAAATRALSTSMASTPVGLIAAGIALIVTQFIAYRSALGEVNEEHDKYRDQIKEEVTTAQALFGTLKRNVDITSKRTEAIEEINRKYGQYLPNLLDEKSTLEDIDKAQDRVIKGLITRITLTAQQEKLNKAIADNFTVIEEATDRINKAGVIQGFEGLQDLDEVDLQNIFENLPKLERFEQLTKQIAGNFTDATAEARAEQEALRQELGELIPIYQKLPNLQLIGLDRTTQTFQRAADLRREIDLLGQRYRGNNALIQDQFDLVNKLQEKLDGLIVDRPTGGGGIVPDADITTEEELEKERKKAEQLLDINREYLLKKAEQEYLLRVNSIQESGDAEIEKELQLIKAKESYESAKTAIVQQSANERIKLYKGESEKDKSARTEIINEILQAEVDYNETLKKLRQEEISIEITKAKAAFEVMQDSVERELDLLEAEQKKKEIELREAGVSEVEIERYFQQQRNEVIREHSEKRLDYAEKMGELLLEAEFLYSDRTLQDERKYEEKKLALKREFLEKERQLLINAEASPENVLRLQEINNELKKIDNTLKDMGKGKTIAEIIGLGDEIIEGFNLVGQQVLSIAQAVNEYNNTMFENLIKQQDAAIELYDKKIEKLTADLENATGMQREQIEFQIAHERKLQEEAQEEKEAIQREQFEKNKEYSIATALINAALAVTKTFAELGPIAGAIAAIGLGITTAYQIETIKAQQFYNDGGLIPKFEQGVSLQEFPAKTGGKIKGPSHKNKGVKFVTRKGFIGEAEGDEIILTRGVAKNPYLRRIASLINVLGGGINFEGGGVIPQIRNIPIPQFQFGGALSNSEAVPQFSTGQIIPSSGDHETMKELSKKFDALITVFNDKQFILSLSEVSKGISQLKKIEDAADL